MVAGTTIHSEHLSENYPVPTICVFENISVIEKKDKENRNYKVKKCENLKSLDSESKEMIEFM